MIMNSFYVSPHTLMIQYKPGLVLLYQVLLRKGVITDASIYEFFDEFNNADSSFRKVQYQDVSCFSLSDCLLDNPAGIKVPSTIPDFAEASPEEFIKLLKSYSILVENDDYINRLGKTANLFDRNHIGNFHQQIGNYLFKSRKGDPEEWWIFQKFKKDLSGPRDNPYLWVQKRFMDEFFKKDLSEQTWLDFGCGVGYYTDFFAQRNAKVVGVDPSELYIDLACKNFAGEGQIEYRVAAFEKPDDFKVLSNEKYDGIFMSDVFLYYFESYKKLDITPTQLLIELRKILTENGSIYIMDPHGFFHLQPWMGEESPYIICPEYKHRKFRVTPNLEEISKSVEDAGLFIRRVRELYCPEDEVGEALSKKVLKEFPIWWFFELKRI